MLPNLLGSNYVVQLLNSSLNEALPLLFLFFSFFFFPFKPCLYSILEYAG